MDPELKVLAQKTVDTIYQTVKQATAQEFHKLGSNIGIGADGTPTKYIDKIAEDAALQLLETSVLPVNVLSEEAGFLDHGSEYTFVLDPVDGTRNAYRGIPFYAVSLAVGKTMLSDVEYGIVKNIPTGDVFLAERGVGAFQNNQQIRVCEVPSKQPLSSLTLGKNFDAKTLKLAKKHYVRSLGSASLEMCMVALGALDYYVVGREYMRVTDIAASTLIIREAGGLVKNMQGDELEMGFTLDERTSVVAACTEDSIQCIIV